jgi:hypothetical protein
MLSSTACEPRPGRLHDQIVRSNGEFRVRIEIYDEGNKAHMFEPGCHLRLVSAPMASDSWRQFGQAYLSRCDQDFTDRIRFVNGQTAYTFMQWWYSVTMDGGRSWTTWDVPAHLPRRAFYNPRLIQDVAVNADGSGTMTLNPDGVADKQRLVLHTESFGREWKAED